MNRLSLLTTVVLVALAPVQSQAANPFNGRWDITITTPNGTSPRWMEVIEKDGELQIRIQPAGGAVRAAAGYKMDGSRLVITESAARNKQPETSWELSVAGDKLTGVQKSGDREAQIAGVRAPALKREPPKAWSAPEPLFNGKDLTGWETFGRQQSFWMVKDGELVNEQRGANIRTTRKFDDFKLHIEFFCPEKGNSGLYLRGRYEIQIGTEGGANPAREMGAIFGHFPAKGDMPLRLGEWQTYDVTLVGRYVTVIRNGVAIHENQEIPGPTGGALDSNESEPGPIYIQGDHNGGLRFRNITISSPKR